MAGTYPFATVTSESARIVKAHYASSPSPSTHRHHERTLPMSANPTRAKPILVEPEVEPIAEHTTTPSDAKDLDALWQDPGLGDGIVDVNYHSVPVGKPKDFFRTHPDPLYRRRTEIYTHKPEGAIDEQHFIV